MKNFTTMILAAGFGSRMKDLTEKIPKPLLKIKNTTLLSNTINFFENIGCNRFILNTHYLYKELNNYINSMHSDKDIILRSLRRNNVLISYSFLKKYKNLIFIGLEDEFNELKRQVPNLGFYNCKNFLEMAQIIKGNKFFLGNITFGYCLAEAMKVPRLLECCHDGDLAAVHPNGKKFL